MSTWLKFNDDATGLDYYHNPATNETRWDRPEDFRDSITEANAWVTFYDDDAQKYYYYNSVTEETSWEMPPELQSSGGAATVTSTGWNEEYDETEQKHYYVNETTGETTWEKPVAVVSESEDNSKLPAYPAPEVPESIVTEGSVEENAAVDITIVESEEAVSSPVPPPVTKSSTNSPNPFADDDDDHEPVNQASTAAAASAAEPTVVVAPLVAQSASPAAVLPTATKAMSIAPAPVRMSMVMHNTAAVKGASMGPRILAPIAYGTVAKPPPSASSNPFGDDEDDASAAVSEPTSKPRPLATKMVIPKPPVTATAAATPVTAATAPVKKTPTVSASKNPFGDDDGSDAKNGRGTYARPPPSHSNPFGPPDPPSNSSSSRSGGGRGANGSGPSPKFMQTIKKGSPLLAAAATPPPPPPISAVPTSSFRGAVSPAQLLAVNAGSSSPPQNVAIMSNNMKLLVKIGVKPAVADSALRDNGNNWIAALQSINQQLIIAVRADPYNTQLSMWGSRITVRIKSWLPNIIEKDKPDYHTGYVCVVNYSSIYSDRNVHPWQLILRYNAFYKLYCIVCKHLKYTNLKAEFPLATTGHWVWGITDDIRNERMNKFDTWMRELLVNPILMTTKEIIDAVNSMLEIDSRITE